MNRLRHPPIQIGLTVLVTLPWIGIELQHLLVAAGILKGSPFVVGTGVEVLLTGVAILGASFLLAWGAETAEKDVPRAFAIAVLAVLAVAPEYAVDAFYAWNAGAGSATVDSCSQLDPATIEAEATALARSCHDANLAVANMTGANRILIGLGWSGIALFTVHRAIGTSDPAVENREGWLRDAVTLSRDISTEITFLLLATVWAFLVPLGGGIDALDTLVLVGLYLSYILIIVRGEVVHEDDHVGVPKYLQRLPKSGRVASVLSLFAYSGITIFAAVETFAHGLESLGQAAGVPSFFMIQWIAPLASESPELIVVVVLVMKARSTAGFNALISSKLNQWTLLIGTLAVVYSISLGGYGVLPFDQRQSAEIWITAAQSYFAIALLIDLEITVREAIALLVLFVSQVVLEFLFIRVLTVPDGLSYDLLIAYTAVYLIAGTIVFYRRRRHLRSVLGFAADTARTAAGKEPARSEFSD